eukprot:913906_1
MSPLLRLFIWFLTIQCIASHWLDLTNLPKSNFGMAVGLHEVSRSIYLIGGLNTQTQFTEYSIDLNTFGPIETIASSVALWSYVQFWTQQHDIVYMMNHSPRSLVAFDLTTHSYSESFPSLQLDPGQYSCLASSMDYLYITGGTSQQNTLQVFQIIINQWTVSKYQMNTGRSYHACVVHDGHLYVMGGYGAGYLTSTERIDTNGITSSIWENSATLVQGVVYARAVSCGDNLFVVGGMYGGAQVDIAQLIDPLLQTTSAQYMPYAVDKMGTVCFEEDIYVFGGQPVDNVFFYTEFTDDPTKNPTQRPIFRTRMPSVRPSSFPSRAPSDNPSNTPSDTPTVATETPSNDPTRYPSNVPINAPTISTEPPSHDPTRSPSNVPSSSPTQVPSQFPSVVPSQTPTQIPSNAPSNVPTVPTIAPSDVPSNTPTVAPIEVETTEEEGRGSDHDAPANSGVFEGFSSTQVALIVVLVILSLILLIVLIVMVVIKWKTERQIKLDVENIEKQHRSIYGEQEEHDGDDGTTVDDTNPNAFEGDLGKDRSEPNEDDILAQVLALSLAEEEEAREKEQMEMMKQIKIMKQIEEEQERKRQEQIESEQVRGRDDDEASLPESDHDSEDGVLVGVSLSESDHGSDDDVLKTDKITTVGNEQIVDEYKQDVEDVADNPTSPNYNVKMVFNAGTMEQGGIQLAGETDSDDDIMDAVVVDHYHEDEVLFGTGDLPESDNSDDDVLIGANIAVTDGGGGTL